MKKNKQKIDKSNKVPFYLKPLEKTLEKMTNSLLAYFFAYAKEIYKEEREYEQWLSCFHAFMTSSQNNERSVDK